MKKIAILILLFLTACSPKKIMVADDNMQDYNSRKIIKDFIKIIDNNDSVSLSQKTKFPLNRELPLSPLVDDVAMVDRFDEIFDEKFKGLIVNSDMKEDWTEVGAKGIMFSSGMLWLDFQGNLIAVNYQSDTETQKAAIIKAEQNTDLHESVRVYNKGVLEMTTASYQIRIDDLGNYKYRYTSWSKSQSLKDKPELILKDAEVINEGNAGSKRFIFKNGRYKYEVFIIKLGPNDAPPATLTVYKGSEKLFTEDAITFKD